MLTVEQLRLIAQDPDHPGSNMAKNSLEHIDEAQRKYADNEHILGIIIEGHLRLADASIGSAVKLRSLMQSKIR